VKTQGPVRCSVCATRTRCIIGDIGSRAANAVEPHVVPLRFQRGDTLSAQDDVSAATRLLKVGTALVTRRVLGGQQRTVAFIGRGAPVGLLGYFGIANQTSTVAASVVHACDLPHDALRDAARGQPWIQRRITELAATAAGNLADWSASVRAVGTVSQLAYVLLLLQRAQGSDAVELPQHKDLADLLGTRRETVARAFSALEAEGALRSIAPRRCELAVDALHARLVALAPLSGLPG
jgi:CRP/FNR family transcriptional regulator, anaerobic regulatory protein